MFGLWVETRVTRDNIQTPHRSAERNQSYHGVTMVTAAPLCQNHKKKKNLRDEKRCNHEVNSTFVFLHLQQLSLVGEMATGTSLHPPLSLTVIYLVDQLGLHCMHVCDWFLIPLSPGHAWRCPFTDAGICLPVRNTVAKFPEAEDLHLVSRLL